MPDNINICENDSTPLSGRGAKFRDSILNAGGAAGALQISCCYLD